MPGLLYVHGGIQQLSLLQDSLLGHIPPEGEYPSGQGQPVQGTESSFLHVLVSVSQVLHSVLLQSLLVEQLIPQCGGGGGGSFLQQFSLSQDSLLLGHIPPEGEYPSGQDQPVQGTDSSFLHVLVSVSQVLHSVLLQSLLVEQFIPQYAGGGGGGVGVGFGGGGFGFGSGVMHFPKSGSGPGTAPRHSEHPLFLQLSFVKHEILLHGDGGGGFGCGFVVQQ
jgi:hypothetical protein